MLIKPRIGWGRREGHSWNCTLVNTEGMLQRQPQILFVPGIFLLKILCARKSNYLKAFLTIAGPLFLFLLFIF